MSFSHAVMGATPPPKAARVTDKLTLATLAVSELEHARDELLAACRAAADLLRRCDAEQRPNDLPYATDDDWDAVVAQLASAIRAAEWQAMAVE